MTAIVITQLRPSVAVGGPRTTFASKTEALAAAQQRYPGRDVQIKE